jgi:hypothetical protein
VSVTIYDVANTLAREQKVAAGAGVLMHAVTALEIAVKTFAHEMTTYVYDH